jgi:hypothetical protein
MNWYKLKISSKIYGYWIPPDGKLIPVGFEEHGKKLTQLGVSGGYTRAFSMGWIRIITGDSNSMSIEIESRKPNSEQIHSILKLYNSLFADELQRPMIFMDYIGKTLKANSYESLQFALEYGKQPRILFAQINKKSFPIEPTPREDYIDYFHYRHPKDEGPFYLWTIDIDFNLKTRKIDNRINSHMDWTKFEFTNSLASGRMGKRNGKTIVTMTLNNVSKTKEQYIRNRVEEILNEKFGYPIIYEF